MRISNLLGSKNLLSRHFISHMANINSKVHLSNVLSSEQLELVRAKVEPLIVYLEGLPDSQISVDKDFISKLLEYAEVTFSEETSTNL
jgi:hypothetical protein